MANIMQMFRAKNRPKRDGYDLSNRLCFTAKAGELLPVYSKIMIQGQKENLNTKWATRTMPLNTAAFTRFREYYDWYFVPLHLLWNKFNDWSVQLDKDTLQASSINGTAPLSEFHPQFTSVQIDNYLQSLINGGHDVLANQFNYNRAELTCKLLHMLGYGDFYHNLEEEPTKKVIRNVALAPWRLLAYQKIRMDFYRYSQWESPRNEMWNVNYMNGEEMMLPIEDIDVSKESMFDLQYANWNKDLFMGLLPNSQYGDEATVDLSSLLSSATAWNGINIRSQSSSGNEDVTTNSNRFLQSGSNPIWSISDVQIQSLTTALGLKSENLVNAFTILALRQAEMMQKYKEIKQSNPEDFPSQSEAIFGYKPSMAYSSRCMYVKGYNSNIAIDPVINQNITENSDSTLNSADVAGAAYATGGGNGSFTAPCPGILMCIYHVRPLLDYAINGIALENLKTRVTDYANPIFDKTGMTQVPLMALANLIDTDVDLIPLPNLLGYAPNYIDYKTDIDRVCGAFYNGGLQSWVAPITSDYIEQFLKKQGDLYGFRGVDKNFFKINPNVVDPIFSGETANSSVTSDKFLCCAYFNLTAVLPLDAQGLPY